MQAQFSAQTLAEIFRDLYVHERSGALILSRGETEKRVHFDRGMILYAESTVDAETLGTRLTDSGRLSKGSLAEANDALVGDRSVPALARTLLARELIGRATMNQAAREVVDRVVESVFGWEGGSARFVSGPVGETPFETDILATIEVILLGTSCMAGFEPIHEAMQGLDNRLRFRTPTPIPVERLALSPSHGFILSRVDGNTSLNEVISILPPGEEGTAARFLFGLLVMGILEYEPPLGEGPFQVRDLIRDHADLQAMERMQEQLIRRAFARCQGQNHYEILNVSPQATRAEIERAYQEQKAEFGRDRLLPKMRARFKSELTLIESRMIETFLTLSQPERRAAAQAASDVSSAARDDFVVQDLNVRVEMDRAKSKVALDKANRVADAYYAKARKAMLEGDFHNAIQYGKLSISYNPSDARYYYLIADCQSRNPEGRWQRMAEENFTKATELDPWNPEYWISLGRLYKKRGLKLRAKRQFQEALKLIPNSVELIRELDALR
jgi:tetratricopeptide (TPR) repeat protein